MFSLKPNKMQSLDEAFMTIATIWEAVVSHFYVWDLGGHYFLWILLQLLSTNFVSANNNQELGLDLQLKNLDCLLLIICFLNQSLPTSSLTTWKS